MAALKTKQHDADVFEFISTFANVFSGNPEHEYLLKDLGKYTIGKACIYVKKLSDIDLDALKRLMYATIDFLEDKYGKN